MIKTFFKELAEKEGGKFSYSDEDISIGMGVRSPSVIFQVKFDYKGNEFLIDNRTGTNFVAKIICKVSPELRHVNFSLESRSPLSSLFSRNKSKFKISCTNQNFLHFLNTDKSLNKIGEIAQKTKFHPEIKCNGENRNVEIVSKYHLEFEDWTQVIEPLIQFYKNVIDEFENNYKYLSNSQYQLKNKEF